jgi:hypothetical protein
VWFISKTLFKKLLKLLPRKPLTNLDLKKFANILHIPNFRGIFMRNKLPKTIKKNESAIINLDDFNGEGSHWTAYVKKGKHITYFDSFGNLRPPLELIRYFHSDGIQNIIKYNHNKYQSYKESNCGHLCLEFLYKNM